MRLGRVRWLWLGACALVVLSSPVLAVEEDAATTYAVGRHLAKKGRNTAALAAYERAFELDPTLPGLGLSLGVAYFGLGRSGAARDALLRVTAAEPDNGPALLLLGMAELALGRGDDAIGHLEAARSADPELEQLALYNIGIAHSRSGRTEQAKASLERSIEVETTRLAMDAGSVLDALERPIFEDGPWELTLRLGWEYDDNVSSSAVDVQTQTADQAFIAEFGSSYSFLDQSGRQLEVGYDFYQSLYAELDDFDFQLHGLWVAGSHQAGPIDLEGSYRFSTATLGGESFLRMHELRPGFAFAPRSWWYGNAGLGLSRKDYDGERDAWAVSLGVDNFFFLHGRRTYATSGVRLEHEDARGPEFDYTGLQLRAALHFGLAAAESPLGKLDLDLSYRFHWKHYANETSSIGALRRDDIHSVGVGLRRPLTRFLDARFDYRYVLANSNLPAADYRQNVVSFSFGVRL